jgi:multiple sugar transport system substrate-binding protein
VIDSLQKVADLSVTYHVAPNPIQQQRFKMFQDPFVSGKIAMGMTGAWFLETNARTIRRFHWAVAAVPLGKVRKDVLFTDPMMISRGSHHPKEAWQFVKFLLSPEGQGIFMKGYCCLSMRKSMLSSVLASKAPPGQPFSQVQQAVLGAFAHAQESSNHNIAQWAAIENLVNAELDNVWNGKKTMAQEAPTLQAKLNSLLQQNIKRFGSGR